jgi:Tfp pilus assembly protein PilO
MNLLNLKSWSERRQVLAIIVMAGTLLFLLWFFLLLPQSRTRSRLTRDISQMRQQLEQKNALLGQDTLLRRKQIEFERNEALLAEWKETTERLSAFTNRQELVAARIGHIDFKVALFDVRQRLRNKSKALDISLPYDLGMADSVSGNEDARKLMLQLRAVETLVDLALDQKINTLRHVQPLAPVRHDAEGSQESFFEEYPVRVEFFGSMENLYDLLRATLAPQHMFVLRNVKIEAPARDRPEALNISLVMGALVFLKSPEEMRLAPAKATRQMSPMGY